MRHRGLGQPHLGFRQRERPAAVVVSIFAPCPVSTRRPTPRADRSCTVLTRWARVRPSRSSGREVVIDVAGVDAGDLQRVALQVQRLGAVRLGDAGVADQHVS